MFFSKNPFFQQEHYKLLDLRFSAQLLLEIKGRSETEITKYKKAYDFFMKHPTKYDGATIVKDLVDVKNGDYYLDLDAMYHDYEYINGANANYIKKWRSDITYIKNMELNGKGIRVFRFLVLTVLGAYLPIKKYFKQWI